MEIMLFEIIKNAIIVGSGSFIGGVVRYLISFAMKGVCNGFPWATLLVNLLGCFFIGLLWGFFSRTSVVDNNWQLFLMAGICGGFTTFSTFSKEALAMFQCCDYLSFASYIGISVIVGIALVALGYYVVR